MKSRKWRSLLHKLEYLKLDLEEKEDEIRNIESMFLTRLAEMDPGFSNTPPPPQPPTPQPTETGESNEKKTVEVEIKDQTGSPNPETPEGEAQPTVADDRPENMKKLWKAIAGATHPDRTGNDPEKTELYKKATRAWDGKKYEDLISIALELDIPTEEADENAITLLEGRSTQISGRISQIENSVLWQWHQAPPDKKDVIIRLYLASRGRRK